MSSRLAVVFCVGIACAGCSTAQTKADRFIKAGDGFAAEGRNYAAAIQYLNAIKQTPDSSSAYRKLGLAHLAAGDAGAAYRSFTKAVDLDPADSSRVSMPRACCSRRAWTTSPRCAPSRCSSATPGTSTRSSSPRARWPNCGRPTKRSHACRSLSDTRKEARVLVAIAEIKDRANDTAGAERAFMDAVAADPNLVEARTTYAAFLLEADRVEEAETQLKHAYDTAPDDELTNRALAAIYLATDRPDLAEAFLRRAADRGAQTLHSSLALADFYGSQGRYDEAKAALSGMARAENADAAAAQVRLAALEYVSGSREEGRRLLARVIKRHPTPEALALEERFNEAEGR